MSKFNKFVKINLEQYQYCGCNYPNAEIKIDESIDRVPKYSFYSAIIKEVILNPNTQVIEEGSFAESNIKLNIDHNTELKIISNGSFYHSHTQSDIIFPQSLEMIGSYAFANATTLKKATIVQSNI